MYTKQMLPHETLDFNSSEIIYYLSTNTSSILSMDVVSHFRPRPVIFHSMWSGAFGKSFEIPTLILCIKL
jgi:hypothetical protein